jgi:hypothetical protein
MSLDREMAALERQWERRSRRKEVLCAVAWAAFALIVFAGTAFETGRATGETGKVARQLPCALVMNSGAAGAGEASHRAGPSIVADQLHSKMEGNCR